MTAQKWMPPDYVIEAGLNASGDTTQGKPDTTDSTRPSRPDLLATAHAFLDAGLSVVPVKADGSKAPALGKNWDGYSKERPSRDQIHKWFATGRYDGLGFLNGAVSGDAECVEFEGCAVEEGIFDKFAQRMNERGLGPIFDRIFDGWTEKSPSGGIHLHYRITDGTANGNTKLAERPSTPEELAANPGAKTQVLIETRGEGGFIITAPSFGRSLDLAKHKPGSAWTLVCGGPETMAEITSAERDALWSVAREFHEGPKKGEGPEATDSTSNPGNTSGDPILTAAFADPEWKGISALDDYQARTTWREILEPEGWKWVRAAGERDYWTRPGKDEGVSASTIENGPLFVFSTSTNLPDGEGLSKGQYYAAIHHNGDIKSAAKALYAKGYGTRQGEQNDEGATDGKDDSQGGRRQVQLTQASTITIKPVTWLWDQRLALGTLALLAGREGEGKSTISAWLIAAVTNGALPGHHLGQPKSVFISATEDSWESTIVPRLMAAGANLDRVFGIDVVTSTGVHGDLVMPKDIPAMKELATAHNAALLVLDPLMSRLAHGIDSHKDAEVRTALEPLAKFANETAVTVIGLMHFNKGATNDPLNAVMASKAFTAVARSVHTVIRDADDGSTRYYGTPKNNLGRDDLPLLSFTISGHPITTETGTIWTSKVVWGEEVQEDVRDVMARATDTTDRTATQEAADWLSDYMLKEGGRVRSRDAQRAGQAAGHSQSALKRARGRLKLEVRSQGFPRETIWATPGLVDEFKPGNSSSGLQSGHSSQGSDPTELTEPTEPTAGSFGPVSSVSSATSSPQDRELTELLSLTENQSPASPVHGCAGASCQTIGCLERAT